MDYMWVNKRMEMMGSRSSPRFVSRSSSHHYRLSDGIHKVPSSVTLWPCEMTDLSPTGFLQQQSNHNTTGTTTTTASSSSRHQQQQQHHLHHHHHHGGHVPHGHGHLYSSLSLSSSGGGGGIGIPGIVGSTSAGIGGSSGGSVHHATNSHSSSIRAPPVGSGGGRLFSYFGNDHEHERKKSETSFFNLGFRRKSTVVYYAATD